MKIRKITSPENQTRTWLSCSLVVGVRYLGAAWMLTQGNTNFNWGPVELRAYPCCAAPWLHFLQKERGRRNVKRRHGARRDPAGASYSSWACSSSALPKAGLCVKHPVYIQPILIVVVTKVWAVSICIGCHKILLQYIFLQASCFLNSSPGPHATLPEIDFSIFLTVLELTSCLCAYKWL